MTHFRSEAALQRTLLAHLNALENAFFWRANTGAAELGGRMVRFGLPGQADIQGVLDGRAVFVEVKSELGKQSPDQRMFEINVVAAGGVYILARGFEETMAAVRGL